MRLRKNGWLKYEDLLEARALAGRSASEIAAELADSHGLRVTRCAVIGACYRLGIALAGRPGAKGAGA